jgi:hypothetical protein
MSKIRQSARDEECTVRLPGVCRWLPEYTILSHAPWGSAGKGRGIKSLDVAGAYCCTACDAVIDRQAKPPEGMTREEVELAWFHGHMRTLVRFKDKGLI